MCGHLLPRNVTSALAALALSLLLAPAAWADRYSDCYQRADNHRRVNGCTEIINSSAESRKNRVIAYAGRGIAYGRLGA